MESDLEWICLESTFLRESRTAYAGERGQKRWAASPARSPRKDIPCWRCGLVRLQLARLRGLQVFEDLIECHPLDAGEEFCLYSQGGEDVLLRDQAHSAGHLTEFLSPLAPPQRLHDAIEINAI